LNRLTYQPCALEHIAKIKPQPGEEVDKAHFMTDEFNHVLKKGMSVSFWDGEDCVGAGGVAPIYAHRAMAWAFLGANSGPYMHQITRKARQLFELYPAKRIEMLVDYKFDAGHRWAKVLGFEVEAARMRMSGIYGDDETMYVRIKG